MSLKTILVEDSPVIRESLIPALTEMANIEILAVAESAAGALSALGAHQETWELTVLDLQLREGNGLTVLRAVRDRRPHQHAVVLTNYATPDIRSRCLEAGADAVFDKSTEIEALFELCQRYAAERPG